MYLIAFWRAKHQAGYRHRARIRPFARLRHSYSAVLKATVRHPQECAGNRQHPCGHHHARNRHHRTLRQRRPFRLLSPLRGQQAHLQRQEKWRRQPDERNIGCAATLRFARGQRPFRNNARPRLVGSAVPLSNGLSMGDRALGGIPSSDCLRTISWAVGRVWIMVYLDG
jgi:hypothetical protein